MRRAGLLLAGMVAAMLIVCGAVLAQAQPSESGRPADRYIVVLKDDVSSSGHSAHGMARRYGMRVGFVYTHALKGFSAVIPSERVAEVRNNAQVDYIALDMTVTASAQALPWGINLVDADVSSTKAGNGSGAVTGVNAYIIDTGVYKHPDLNVVNRVNFARDGKNYDCNGHGTHVAGTLAAKDNAAAVVGVSPGSPLTAVKVLGCGGEGTAATVLAGIDWVTAHAKKPAVANLSLTLSAPCRRAPSICQVIDDAVRKSRNSGIFYSVAAGNQGKNACNYSPARAGAGTNNGIVTTAATNKNNAATSFSNYGSCVDLWAPGAYIRSTRKGGGTTIMSGTSMAAPHVSGGGALYRKLHPGTGPSGVERALKNAAKSPGTKSKDRRMIRLENVDTF
jgi:aqualysin 1